MSCEKLTTNYRVTAQRAMLPYTYIMNWKYIKIALLVVLGLLIIIPSLMYITAIDWSKKHSTRVAALPLFDSTVNDGEYRLKANDLEFLIRVKGMKNKGSGVILLHGFPESSLMWQPLLDEAAAQGYRMLAFDQRGYSPDARPTEVSAYQIDNLVSDILAVADQVGFDTFHLVGHDWGAGVGWKTVMDFPERIHTWTAMAVPHSGVFFKALTNHPEQQKRSAYMKRLQMPFLPELLFHLNQKKVTDGLKGRWADEEIAECLAIQREYGALTAALNWYRAMNLEEISDNAFLEKDILRPTLYIWGTKDPVIARAIIPLQKPLIKAAYQEISLETGHSLIQSKTDTVVNAILNHFEK